MLGEMSSEMLMDKRILLPKVGNACRCLFGPVDHEEVRRTLRRELRVLTERNREKWNFDFQQERPLPGRYSWERTSEDEDVPSAYEMPRLTVSMKLFPVAGALPTHAGPGLSGSEDSVLETEAVSAPPDPSTSTTEVPVQVTASTSTATQTSPRKRKQSQAHITGKYILLHFI